MVTAVMLLNWTDQGIKNVKDSPKRLDGMKKLVTTRLAPLASSRKHSHDA
jgi:uncharacterized protein with GYD domain